MVCYQATTRVPDSHLALGVTVASIYLHMYPGFSKLTGIDFICVDLGSPKSSPSELWSEQVPREEMGKEISRQANAHAHPFHFHCGMAAYSVLIISLCNMLSLWRNVFPHSDPKPSPYILLGASYRTRAQPAHMSAGS